MLNYAELKRRPSLLPMVGTEVPLHNPTGGPNAVCEGRDKCYPLYPSEFSHFVSLGRDGKRTGVA